MKDKTSKEQYPVWAQEAANKIDIRPGVVKMGTKKNEINLAQTTSVLPAKKVAPFWNSKTGEELAQEQGVKPINDISDLFGYWPDGADFESFFDAAVNSRKHAEAK